tara:strand:+ start:85 stop:546 length:462 start_codon:yes stop_codon:yes gene_type:complete
MADTSLSEKKIGLLVWQVSNLWQNRLRKILKLSNITLNEYLIMESIIDLQKSNNLISQNIVSFFSGIDVSVTSVILKMLENKRFIKREINDDNRKKTIIMLSAGKKIFEDIYPKIKIEEQEIFEKLQSEQNNFKNSLKLVLGKKIRVRADYNI